MFNDLTAIQNLLTEQGVLPVNFNPIVFTIIFLFTLIWSLAWKGLGLWKSAKNNHQWWFIALLISNTLGILDLIYIFIFGKKKEFSEKKAEE